MNSRTRWITLLQVALWAFVSGCAAKGVNGLKPVEPADQPRPVFFMELRLIIDARPTDPKQAQATTLTPTGELEWLFDNVSGALKRIGNARPIDPSIAGIINYELRARGKIQTTHRRAISILIPGEHEFRIDDFIVAQSVESGSELKLSVLNSEVRIPLRESRVVPISQEMIINGIPYRLTANLVADGRGFFIAESPDDAVLKRK